MRKNLKFVVFAGLAGSCFAAQAADIVKTNNYDALNLGSSWVGGLVPGSNDRAVYSQSVILTNELGGDLSWNGIVLTNNTKSWIINGSNTLTLGAGGIDMGAAGNNFTISAKVNLGAGQTWNIAGSRIITIGGLVSGGATLIKAGAGTLTITNSGSTYSGGTVVNGGTLSCSQDNPLGSGSLTLNDGVFFSLPGGGTITNAVVIPVGQNATINGNGTLNGPLSGSGSLTHGGNGAFVLVLSADNSGFSGSITNAAVVSIKNKNSLGTGKLYMNNGTNSALAAQADLLGFNAITNNIVLLNTAKLEQPVALVHSS
jgi:autotransporter-associated beta strand protein